MRKILYIDYVQQKGHVNFHQIHINSLKNAGYDVKLILHNDIAKQLSYSKKDYVLTLPSFLNQRDNCPVLNRIIFIFTLIYIKRCVKLKSYDNVIIACLDEITLGLFPLQKNMNIICHGNADNFRNPVKRFFLKKLSRKNSFIVFNERMARPFKEHFIDRVYIVSHGCPHPFIPANVELPINIYKFKKIIFHPSTKISDEFLHQYVGDSRLSAFLKKNNALLLLRNQQEGIHETKNIQFISQYLTQEQYQQLFFRADLILLAYPPSFGYQVSGVSFECLANQKNLLVLQHPSLQYCHKYYNYDPIFCNFDEFCDKLQNLFDDKGYKCTVSLNQLSPDYTLILNS